MLPRAHKLKCFKMEVGGGGGGVGGKGGISAEPHLVLSLAGGSTQSL